MAYSGWEIGEEDRAMLLTLFRPQFPDVIAHHVTLSPGVKKGTPAPDAADIRVVGYVKGEGVEALIVEVNGTTKRERGGHYHITWSIDREAGFQPVHSNDLIAEKGFERIVSVIPIKTIPKVFY